MSDTHNDTTETQEKPKMARDWYTTSEAAAELGLSPATVRDAVRRGAIKAEQVHGRLNGISAAEIARYARENQGGKGWDQRRSHEYTPSRGAGYARAYRERKKAQQQEQPTGQSAKE